MARNAPEEKLYKIGEVCRMADVQPYVLRYWETEFPALSPAKSRSGQRVYNEKELAIIRRIKELLYDEGYTIAGAKKKLEGELAAGTLGRVEPDDADEVERAEVGEEGEEGEGEEAEEAPAAEPSANDDGDADEVAEQLALEAPPAPVARVVKPAPRLDTRGAERVETLRAGIDQALRAAREILALLDSKPPAK